MKRFTKLKPITSLVDDKKAREDSIKYRNDFLEIIDYEGKSLIKTQDSVFCIPYLIEKNQFFIKKEYVPSFKWRDKTPDHLSLIGGPIPQGETSDMALLRELQTGGGIVLSPEFKIDFEPPLFLSQISTNKIYFSVISLSERDYHEVPINPKNTPPARVDLKYINNLICGDIITDWAVMKFKQYLNIG